MELSVSAKKIITNAQAFRVESIFCKSFITSLFIPAFVAFLYNIFAWGPMKTWVLVVPAVYTVLLTILSITYTAVQ